MVVKTKFRIKDYKKILTGYEIDDFVNSKKFKSGNVQTNILIRTTHGKYVVRYYENQSKNRVLFESELLEFLSKKKYPSAMPIKNIRKEKVGIFNKKPFIIFEYVMGKHLRNLDEKQFDSMVRQLAILHKITRNYKSKYIHEQPRTEEYCLKAAKEELKRFKDKDKGKERFNFIKSELSKLFFPKNMTKGIIHCDFDKANLKFHEGNLSGVLDFDDSYYDYRIHDIGILILYWARFYDNKMRYEKARKIMSIYQKYSPLTKSEKEHIFDAMQFACLMIMSWLMYDKWKGKDLFRILSRIVEENDRVGRVEFYKQLFH